MGSQRTTGELPTSTPQGATPRPPGASATSGPTAMRLPHRSGDDRLIAGVASGLAASFGVPPLLVQLAFVVLAASGSGLILYAVGWVVMPLAHADDDISERPLDADGAQIRSMGVATTVIGVLLLVRQLGAGFDPSVVLPVGLVGAGVVAIWTRLPTSLSSGDGPFDIRSFDLARIIGGLVLVAAGVSTFLAAQFDFEAVGGMLAILVVMGGVAVIFLPWWMRAGKDLAAERRLRIRADERAEVAAHLHDSVLQTLTLIQKQSDDPAAVSTLARGQERELRRWLFNGPERVDGLDFGTGLRERMADVETMHGVAIDVVMVGVAEVSQRNEALIAAAGEAATNAAKFAGVDSIDVFAEARDDGIEVFIRDRGCGFDLASVDDDRRGVSESIVGRMQRAGGTAEIHTEPGFGTEVELRLEEETNT